MFIEEKIEGENVFRGKESLELLHFGYKPSISEILGNWLKTHQCTNGGTDQQRDETVNGASKHSLV